MRMVNDLIAILLLQFDTGILASFVIIQVTVHLCICFFYKSFVMCYKIYNFEENCKTTKYEEATFYT